MSAAGQPPPHASGLSRLWEAHPSITSPPRRRRARAAAGVLLCLVPLAAADLAISFTGVYGAADLTVSLGAVAGLLLAYLLVRWGRVTAGVVLSLAIMEAGIWFWRLQDTSGGPGETTTLYFLAAPLLVVGLLLPIRAAAVVSPLTLLSTWFFEAYLDQRTGAGLNAEDASLGILLVTVAGLSLAASALAERDARLLERRTAELEVAKRELEEAAAERKRMLSQVSHDMAHPLDPILIQLKLLSRPGGPANLPHSLAVIGRNMDQLKRHVEDLKDLARIEGKALRLSLADVDVAALAAQAAESFRAGAQQKGVALDVAAAGPLPVRADGARLTQVLYNLLGNALKFTPAGGSVRLEAEVHGDQARVSVRDTGRGLAAEEVPLLFRPFSQAHQPGEVAERGTGLGLYICKGIVEAHGGTIAVHSEGLGQGSAFTFQVPRAQAA